MQDLFLGVKNFVDLHNSASAMRKDLHMLPVADRSQNKVALLVFKCLSNKAPDYLQDLFSLKQKNSEYYDLRPESQLHKQWWRCSCSLFYVKKLSKMLSKK